MSNRSHNIARLILPLLLVLIFSSCSTGAIGTPSPGLEEPQTANTDQPAKTSDGPVAADTSTPTPVPTHTAVATLTAEPTQTLVQPTASPIPTATPTFGPAGDGLSAWCLPAGGSIQGLDPLQPPAYALTGTVAGSTLDLNKVPYNGCMFIYHFNQASPDGLSLEIYDQNQTSPWYSVELQPADGDAQASFAFVRHSYIIDPPLWQVSFSLVLRDAGGNELRRDQLNLQRPLPELCWNGRLPNVNTLRCPLMQDLHPWDPGYLTPFPTPKPEE